MRLTQHQPQPACSWLIRLLITGGVVGPLLFLVVFLIEGATRPGYNAFRQQVSYLSLSGQGWMQVLNFLLCGLLLTGFACGMWRLLRPGRSVLWGALLLGVCGLALIIAGLFVTDPGPGYPPGVSSSPQTLHGTIHGVAGLIVFLSIAAASMALARRFAGDPAWHGWALYSLVTGILTLLLFVITTVLSALDQQGVLPNSPAGLFQRADILLAWGWVALLALRLLCQKRPLA
jgi:hypothetical membrane protein